MVRRTRKELDSLLAEFAGLLNRPLAGPNSIRFEYMVGRAGGPVRLVVLLDSGSTMDLFGHEPYTANEMYDRLSLSIQTLKLAERCRSQDEANVPLHRQKFATVSWMVGDITSESNLTDEQAAEWLEANGKYIRDRLVEYGNQDVIPTLLNESGIGVNGDD